MTNSRNASGTPSQQGKTESPSDFVDDSDDSSGGYEQMEDLDARVPCLFCDLTSTTMENAVQHCIDVHKFNIFTIRDKFNLDYYSYLKLINYIRTNRPDADLVNSFETVVWASDEYMKPYDINDPWLWYDLEGLKGLELDDGSSGINPNYVNSENGNITMTHQHFTELLNTIKSLHEQVEEKENRIAELKDVVHCIKEKLPVSIPATNASDDASYFNSYSESHIHWEMLSDSIRTSTYQRAICNNGPVFKDKLVLDVGCGTGILSLMAITAGARKVVAVDQSNILYNALEIARENDMLGKIEYVKGKLEEAVLPVKQFDIIVSEWMGYFLLFEGMLDSVIYARNHFLKKGGIMLPSRCSIYIAGSCDIERHQSLVDFWKDVYGYKMTSMLNLSLKEVTIDLVKPEDVITSSCLVHYIDVDNVNEEDIFFKRDFILFVEKDSCITQIVGYFDANFDLPSPASFVTSPSAPATHWKQTIFLLREPMKVKTGDEVQGTIHCFRLPSEGRSLQVDLTINGQSHSYFLT